MRSLIISYFNFSTPPHRALQHMHVNSGICWHKDVKLDKDLCVLPFFPFGKKQAWHGFLISSFEWGKASEMLYVLCPQKGNFTSKYCCQGHHKHILVQKRVWHGAMQSLCQGKRGQLMFFQKGKLAWCSFQYYLPCLSSWYYLGRHFDFLLCN